MNEKERKDVISEFMEMFPLFRRVILKPVDSTVKEITKTQFAVLLSLSALGTLNMSQLASEIGVSNQQLTNVVDSLVLKDMVIREEDSNNRRSLLIRLSKNGRQFLKNNHDTAATTLYPLFSILSDDEMEGFLHHTTELKKLIIKLEKNKRPR